MHKGIKNKSRLFFGLKSAPADLSSVNFIFYYGPTFFDCSVYKLSDHRELLNDEQFDKNKDTVLYLHGYLENPNVESIHVLVNAYLMRNDINLIVLDWGDLADGNYAFDAVINAKQLGVEMANILLEMSSNEFNTANLHIVGHSLGGQMAGIIGREIYARSNKEIKLKRISALDPAFPLFYGPSLVTHLNKNDAEFVDVIHTDAWFYGAPSSTGTADFWPNSGKTLQPGCPKRNYRMLSDNDLASHRRSWWFWAESVSKKFEEQFVAVKANNWADFKNGKIIGDNNNSNVFMGHECRTNITGDYFLQTNGVEPFARGKLGTVFVNPNELKGSKYMDTET